MRRPELFEPYIGVGVGEEYPLAGALDDELPTGAFPEAAGQRVVVDEGLGEGAADEVGGVFVGHGGVVGEEEDEGDDGAEAVVVVEIGEGQGVGRSWEGGWEECGLPAGDVEGGRRGRSCHCC